MGVLSVKDIGLSVQAFPADASLPALAAGCDTTPKSPLFGALQSAVGTQLSDDSWRLISAEAIPVRYKPANRCVIRYQLSLEHGKDETFLERNLTIFGKVYAAPEQARSVQALQQRLYDEQFNKTGGSPFLPRPLGLIDELGPTLNQAVQPSQAGDRLVTGTPAPPPPMERGGGG